MPVLNSGGSLVNSDNIVDGSILNADINGAAAIALSKLAGLVGEPGELISIETTAGATHSLTTDGKQQVLVIAVGTHPAASSTAETVSLNYNAVAKHTITIDVGSSFGSERFPFTVMYLEKPAAGTQNITVTTSAGSIQDCVIMVIKLKVT